MTRPDRAQAMGAWRALGLRTVLIAAVAVALAGCGKYGDGSEITGALPDDYRHRHPITIKEGERTLELFVGEARGALTPAQRADIGAFAGDWRREATGGVVIEVPAGTASARAARDALPEIRSILAARGVPPQAVAVQRYQPPDPGTLATVRLNYPKMVAAAGPCGLWPHDLGSSFQRRYLDNGQHWNFGCAHQRNLAAIVENPADLVQPRGETPIYAGRRSIALDKFRKGESPATVYPTAAQGTISNVGQR